jgi:hypothetical protein
MIVKIIIILTFPWVTNQSTEQYQKKIAHYSWCFFQSQESFQYRLPSTEASNVLPPFPVKICRQITCKATCIQRSYICTSVKVIRRFVLGLFLDPEDGGQKCHLKSTQLHGVVSQNIENIPATSNLIHHVSYNESWLHFCNLIITLNKNNFHKPD